jgi:outer membrane protein TolC
MSAPTEADTDERPLPSRGLVASAVSELTQTTRDMAQAVRDMTQAVRDMQDEIRALRKDVQALQLSVAHANEPWNLVRHTSE